MIRRNFSPWTAWGELSTTPYYLMKDLEKEVNRFFNDIVPDKKFTTKSTAASFAPACDIEERQDFYLLNIDLPGVKSEDVKIELNDGRLVVTGERKTETQRNGEPGDKNTLSRRYVERRFGTFQRVFSLPDTVDSEKIEANFQNGVLSIIVPKSEIKQPRQIPIRMKGDRPGADGEVTGRTREDDKNTIEVTPKSA